MAAEYVAGGSSQTAATLFRTTDHLGSTRLVTDSSTSVVSRRDFFPFGEQILAQPSSGRDGISEYNDPQGFPQLFTGKERDEESGLDYFGARYFSASLGRFTSPDWSTIPQPVPYADFRDPQSLNLYAYARNNPLARVDPDGHDDRPCTEGQPGCVDGVQLSTEGEPLGPSPRNRAAADRNPAILSITYSSGDDGGTEGEIEYTLEKPADDEQNYQIVQGETNTGRTSGVSSFGSGTSASSEQNGFTDTVRSGLTFHPASNSVQTFYMVPVDDAGKPRGAPQPVNVRDKEGNVFNALGVYLNGDHRRAFINGRRVNSSTFVPPTKQVP